MKSSCFSKRALKTLNRIGDIYIPRNGEFPSFSEYGGIEHIDKLAGYAPVDDIGDLNMLLGVLGFMPGFVLRFIVHLCAKSPDSNSPISPLLRQLNLAFRGLIFGCYYAERPGSNYNGKDPVELINFSINRVTD